MVKITLSILTIVLFITTILMFNIPVVSSDSGEQSQNADENPLTEKCYKCHDKEPEYKEWKVSGHAKTLATLRKAELAQDSCLRCHSSSIPSDVPLWGKDWRSRATLKTAQNNVGCSSCHRHGSKRKHYLTRSVKKLCVTCHQMDCGCAGGGIIHQSQAEMFAGKGGNGVKRMPSPHIKEMPMRCVACHMEKETSVEKVVARGGHTFVASMESCQRCHLGEDDISIRVSALVSEVNSLLQQVERMLEDTSAQKDSQVYKDAKLNYDMVKGDSGYGFHNFAYAKALLKYSLSLREELLGNKSQKADSSAK